MSTHTPQPPSSNQWPAILLFLAAIGVPGAAAFKFADTISKNPWQAIIIALLYEVCLLILAFLRKVWGQLEDAWSKDTATWVNNLVQKKWFSYKRYYARFLTFQHRDFDIKGLSTQSIYTLELEQVFVDLSIDPKPMHQVSTNPMPSQAPEELLTGKHSLWNYLMSDELKNQHLVILGAPGSGKTTLLKHIALTLVNRKKRRSLSRRIRHAYRFPFLLLLREHTEAIHANSSFSLIEAIQAVLNRWEERPAPEGWVRRVLSKGKCLILLDGLDEVGDTSLREEVVRWVQRQMQAYTTNRFLISSRPFGYRSNPLSGVMVLDVRPFTFEQVQCFVHNWYRTNEVMSSQKDDPGVRMRAKAEAQNLIRRIQQNPALLSMAINPLLLTMISTIHRYRSTLPGKRVELYAEICDVFLGKRQQARDIKVVLSSAQCVSVLQPLAYEMMVREHREIASLDAQEIIKKPLELVHGSMTPEAFLQMIENISGLLLEREQGSYYFAHLTFQEYLAATYICDQRREAMLITHLGESWWEETTRLYSAQTDATNIIEACLNHTAPSIPHLMLAFECLEEALKVQPTIKSQLDRALEQGAEDADPQRKKVVAETILKRRLKEMVLVQEGIYRDMSLILCAEYQLFLDEQRALGKYYQPDHWMNAHFSSGQALLPIVGVRPSSAQAFCDWLTDREQGIWQYRLPKSGEYQSKEIYVRPGWLPFCAWNTFHGYWQEKGSSFEWIQQLGVIQVERSSLDQTIQVIPLDLDLPIRDSNIETSVKVNEWGHFLSYLELALARTRDHALARASVSASILDYANALDCTLDLVLASANVLVRVSAFNTYSSALDLANTLTHASALDLASARASNLASDLARVSTSIFDLDRSKSQCTSSTLDLALLLDLLSICISFSAYNIAFFGPRVSSQSFWKRLFVLGKKNVEPSLKIQDILNQGIEIYQRLERLEKRRQGKELACEGILIVRERRQGMPISEVSK